MVTPTNTSPSPHVNEHLNENVLGMRIGLAIGLLASFVDGSLGYNKNDQLFGPWVALLALTAIFTEGASTEGLSGRHEGGELQGNIRKRKLFEFDDRKYEGHSDKTKIAIKTTGMGVSSLFILGISVLSYGEVHKLLQAWFGAVEDGANDAGYIIGSTFFAAGDVGGHMAFELPSFFSFTTSLLLLMKVAISNLFRSSSDYTPLNAHPVAEEFTKFEHENRAIYVIVSIKLALLAHLIATLGTFGVTSAIITDVAHLATEWGLPQGMILPLQILIGAAAVLNGNGRVAKEIKEFLSDPRFYFSHERIKGHPIFVVLAAALASFGIFFYTLMSFEATREMLYNATHDSHDGSEAHEYELWMNILASIVGGASAPVRAMVQGKAIMTVLPPLLTKAAEEAPQFFSEKMEQVKAFFSKHFAEKPADNLSPQLGTSV